MSQLESSLDHVCSKETFIAFLGALVADQRANGAQWENRTLDLYLGGMQSWLEDMDLENFYKRIERQDVLRTDVNWRVFADILAAAIIYE